VTGFSGGRGSGSFDLPMQLLVPALVVVLSAGAFLVMWRRRKRPSAPKPEPAVATPAPPVEAQPQNQMRPLLCPTCGGQYPPGLRFCPVDARALVQNSEWSMGTVLQVTCKACHRAFEPTVRFCPYDAQELIPTAPGVAALPVAALPGRPGGKICPRCNERFGGGESFCGRDGSELVTLN
jgi:hypothetical protein